MSHMERSGKTSVDRLFPVRIMPMHHLQSIQALLHSLLGASVLNFDAAHETATVVTRTPRVHRDSEYTHSLTCQPNCCMMQAQCLQRRTCGGETMGPVLNLQDEGSPLC